MTTANTLLARSLPKVVYQGGPFLRNPRITTITFAGDDPALVRRLERFGDSIARSAWWRQVVDSYCTDAGDCIGEGQAGPHVRLAQSLPRNIHDVDLADLLARNADALGPIDTNTLLLVYLPAHVTFSDAFTARFCNGSARGLHRAIRVGAVRVAYAVIPRCGDEAALTATASQEVLEATTNPDPARRGFAFQPGSASGGFTWSGVEPVDPCGLITMDTHRATESGFAVHRAWSNRQAMLGRNPCVPTDDQPFLAAVPARPGIRMTAGNTATVTLQGAAEHDMPDWTISADDKTGRSDQPRRYLELTLDRDTIGAGQTATLTITVRSPCPNERCLVGITSTLGDHSTMWPLSVNTP